MQANSGTSRSRRFCVAIVGAASLGIAAAGVASAAPPSPVPATGADYGAAWLAGRAESSIPLKGFDGVSDDWSLTLDAGLAMAAADVGRTSADLIWSALVAQRESAVATGADNPGRLARAIMLAVALGNDPRNVGVAPGNDLVARLAATRTTTGADAGLFGTDDPTYDGVFRQTYSLMALVAAGQTPDETAIRWLTSQQCADGSWMPYRPSLEVPCAFDGGLFVGPDSNSTGPAVEALAAVSRSGNASAIAAALNWLDINQNNDGGWGFFPGDSSDPNSTALVIQGLVAAQKLDDAAFSDRVGSPLNALLSFQLGCDQPVASRGALTFPGTSNAANTFATAQGTPALAAVAFPLGPRTVAAGVPAIDCASQSSSTTSTPTSAPTSTTTSAPTSTTTSTTTSAPSLSTTSTPTTVASPNPSLASTTTTAGPTDGGASTTSAGDTQPGAQVLGVTASAPSGTSSGSNSTLAATGSDVVPLGGGAAAMILVGALLLAVRARNLREQ